jgi:hypothetical protein
VNLGLPYFHIFFIGFLRKKWEDHGRSNSTRWQTYVAIANIPNGSLKWFFLGNQRTSNFNAGFSRVSMTQEVRLQTGPRQLHHGPNVILEAHPLLSLHCQGRFLHDQF